MKSAEERSPRGHSREEGKKGIEEEWRGALGGVLLLFAIVTVADG